jgi:hypothetical protein
MRWSPTARLANRRLSGGSEVVVDAELRPGGVLLALIVLKQVIASETEGDITSNGDAAAKRR